MTINELLSYCLAKPGAWQDEPWEGDVVVKVGSKIFAFLGAGTSVGVKCGATREVADEWLARYPEDAVVMPYIGRSSALGTKLLSSLAICACLPIARAPTWLRRECHHEKRRARWHGPTCRLTRLRPSPRE